MPSRPRRANPLEGALAHFQRHVRIRQVTMETGFFDVFLRFRFGFRDAYDVCQWAKPTYDQAHLMRVGPDKLESGPFDLRLDFHGDASDFCTLEMRNYTQAHPNNELSDGALLDFPDFSGLCKPEILSRCDMQKISGAHHQNSGIWTENFDVCALASVDVEGVPANWNARNHGSPVQVTGALMNGLTRNVGT